MELISSATATYRGLGRISVCSVSEKSSSYMLSMQCSRPPKSWMMPPTCLFSQLIHWSSLYTMNVSEITFQLSLIMLMCQLITILVSGFEKRTFCGKLNPSLYRLSVRSMMRSSAVYIRQMKDGQGRYTFLNTIGVS